MSGRDMVGAALAVYGPRTTIVAFNTNKKRVEEYTLRCDEMQNEYWERSTEKIKIKRSTRFFSPANSRAILDNIPYRYNNNTIYSFVYK